MHFPLNEPEQASVRYLDGPLLVLAGAGSGKTRVITAKIAHLIDRGFDPAHIAAITFTNKAAREMRERALRLLPKRDGAGAPIICDDLIAMPLTALERDAAAAGRWRDRLSYLLIDEYQDTNPVQYRLLKMVA